MSNAVKKIRWTTESRAPYIGKIVRVGGPNELDSAGNYVCRDDSVSGTKLIQSDWDYPSVANTFGWSIASVQHLPPDGYKEWNPETDRPGVWTEEEIESFKRYEKLKWNCDHHGTDGTVDCPDCGITAAAFIAGAGEYLRNNNGKRAEDPGYF